MHSCEVTQSFADQVRLWALVCAPLEPPGCGLILISGSDATPMTRIFIMSRRAQRNNDR